MKKQGFTLFLWRVLAHRLQRWAQVASLQVGEEVYVIGRDSASVEYSAGSVSRGYEEVNEADAQSVDGDLPPAHWLARVKRGASPTSWLTQVNRHALGDLQRPSSAARVSAVLSPGPEAAPSRSSFVAARAREDQSHIERKIISGEKESLWSRDGGTAEAYRAGVDGAVSPLAPGMPFAPSHSRTNVSFPAQHSAAPLLESGAIPPSLAQETASFPYPALNNAAVSLSSPDGEAPSLAAQKSRRVAPSQDREDPSTLHHMAARPASSPSLFSVAQRENEPGVSYARARISLPPEEGPEGGQRLLSPVDLFPWKESPAQLPVAFAVSRTSSPQDSSGFERMPGAVDPYRVSEQPVQIEDHWPALPERCEAENEDWERAHYAWERQQRLDREQRGSSWNV